MTRRRYLTKTTKAAKYKAQHGRCRECEHRIALVDTLWDHILPLCLSGTNDPDNWQGLCRSCHSVKTKREADMRAKADRQRRFHEGTKKRRGPAMQSRGFDTRLPSNLKNGRVEVRT